MQEVQTIKFGKGLTTGTKIGCRDGRRFAGSGRWFNNDCGPQSGLLVSPPSKQHQRRQGMCTIQLLNLNFTTDHLKGRLQKNKRD